MTFSSCSPARHLLKLSQNMPRTCSLRLSFAPDAWALIITFGSSHSSLSIGKGPTSKTSSPTPAIQPSFSALIKADWSIICPRAMLMRYL